MVKLKEIESAIKNLSKVDLSEFRAWFEEFYAKTWDKQIEEDASSGKLDKPALQAISDFKAGKCKEL
ncbi:MAG: hypothetical protein ACUZ77_11225 [Candidatus Brocadiales bacterium]